MSSAPPIEPAPAGLPANRGCWKGTLYGCGAVAVCIVAVLVGLGIYVQKRPGAITDMLMERIRDRYASDVTPQDKADLEAAYADFRTALEAKRVRRDDLDRVRFTVKLGREVRHDEVVELTRVFREAAENGGRDSGQGT
ncbi:MAG TPA: hypothetical protein VK389_05575, partial [Thermoanaerobaculia bacterium]|nr:hypothetical protein [Thermoanaerobaculia bacterium]